MVKTTAKKFKPTHKPRVPTNKYLEEGWRKLDLDLKDSTENIFKVPAKQWKKRWVLGRKMFNDMFQIVEKNASLFQHPDFPEKLVSKKIWNTTAFNVAWMSADIVESNIKELIW